MEPKPFRKKKEDFFLYFGGAKGAVQWHKDMKIRGTKTRGKKTKIKDNKQRQNLGENYEGMTAKMGGGTSIRIQPAKIAKD